MYQREELDIQQSQYQALHMLVPEASSSAPLPIQEKQVRNQMVSKFR